MNESVIQRFWNNHPCGDGQIGGLAGYRGDYEAFFKTYDRFRYAREAHILGCLDQIDFKGKKTLEIGLGQGADSEQIIRRGAQWTGVDVTWESVERVRLRMDLRMLPRCGEFQASALTLPFANNHFDIVFSHGVLHHIPEILKAQKEIFRVMKPTGELIVMLYSRYSLNYLLSIFLVRRLGLFMLYGLGIRLRGNTGQHIRNAREMGLFRYLRMKTFLHKNTDGPLNPYSKVYSLKTVKEDFPDFEIVKAYKRFMHAPPLPIRRIPLDRLLGWHLWVHLKPKKGGSPILNGCQ